MNSTVRERELKKLEELIKKENEYVMLIKEHKKMILMNDKQLNKLKEKIKEIRKEKNAIKRKHRKEDKEALKPKAKKTKNIKKIVKNDELKKKDIELLNSLVEKQNKEKQNKEKDIELLNSLVEKQNKDKKGKHVDTYLLDALEKYQEAKNKINEKDGHLDDNKKFQILKKKYMEKINDFLYKIKVSASTNDITGIIYNTSMIKSSNFEFNRKRKELREEIEPTEEYKELIKKKREDEKKFSEEAFENRLKKKREDEKNFHEEALENRLKNKLMEASKEEKVEMIKKLPSWISMDSDIVHEVEQKKETPKEIEKRYEKVDEFYINLNKHLKNSKRQKGYLEKLGLSKEQIKNIDDIRNYFDFFPTNVECLKNERINEIIKSATNILEPTIGMGSIIYYIRTQNMNVPITGYDISKDFIDFTLSMFRNDTHLKLEYGNFLNVSNDNDYDLVICNPPFTKGNDKRFYYDFLFKLLYMISNNDVKGEKNIIFICPQLVDKEYETSFSLEQIIEKMSNPKLKQVINDYLDIKVSDKDLEDVRNGELDLEINLTQGQLIKKCSDFGGTNTEAYMYNLIVF